MRAQPEPQAGQALRQAQDRQAPFDCAAASEGGLYL